MSKPREVIADAVSRSFYGQLLIDQSEYRQGICRNMADAVIDALEGMEVPEGMIQAGINAPFCTTDARETAKSVWRAMVGAMRDE